MIQHPSVTNPKIRPLGTRVFADLVRGLPPVLNKPSQPHNREPAVYKIRRDRLVFTSLVTD